MKLSIITINLNNAIGLEKTISSVVAQTFSDYEFLIIDGASVDESIEIIKKNASFVTRWVSERDNGVYNAMNKGIKMAAGDYLLFLNSGDTLYSKDTLKNIFDKEFDTDYIFGASVLDCNKCQLERKLPDKITFYYLYTYTLWHQAMFIKKEVFEKYGYYDEELVITSDWKQYLIALFKYNCSYTIVKDIIAVNDFDGISSLKNNALSKILKEREITLNKFFPGFIEDYKLLHKYKRISPQGILRGIKRRYTEFLSKR